MDSESLLVFRFRESGRTNSSFSIAFIKKEKPLDFSVITE
jgi:hypothetical protein